MAYTVMLSHVTWRGAQKLTADTLEKAKERGDTLVPGIRGGPNAKIIRGGGAPYQIIIRDDKGRIVATRTVDTGWEPAPAPGSEFPKWVRPDGKPEQIVHDAAEEERVMGITPAAEPEPENALMRAAPKPRRPRAAPEPTGDAA